jgi:hypothetical protein
MPKSKTFRLNDLTSAEPDQAALYAITAVPVIIYSFPTPLNGAVKIAVGSGIPLESFPGFIPTYMSDKSFQINNCQTTTDRIS